MIQALQWRPPLLPSPRASSLFQRSTCSTSASASSTCSSSLETSVGGDGDGLTARERRQLRKERRESSNWREEVEERFIKKPKRKKAPWMEELNLDNLARLGPQWWIVRVARLNGQEIAERLGRSLVRNFPTMDFKIYYPFVKEKTRLKNGSYSTKRRPLYPGCVFLHCALNKEVHDFIRECDGVGGFLGSKVGNTKRQINKPKPVEIYEMDAVFQEAREEQEIADRAFEELQKEHTKRLIIDFEESSDENSDARGRKGLKASKKSIIGKESNKSLVPGASVRVLSGPFTDFTGYLRKIEKKNRKATVGLNLFGKESFVDLKVDQIVVETI